MIHHITTSLRSDGRETVRCGAFAVTHPTDALRRLFRQMLAAGLPAGPAEVRGADGALRLKVRCIGTAAQRVLEECPHRGFRLRRFRPRPSAPAVG